jgi:hypothetical protein
MTCRSWYAGNGRYHIADIFRRDELVVLICPLYGNGGPDIVLHQGGELVEDITHGPIEPVRIIVYSSPSHTQEITITVNEETRTFNIDPEEHHNHKLTCTTLFLHDYELIPIWYNWYSSRGVEHFYMYYNGPKLPSDIFTAPNITYILWNFRYWNGEPNTCMDWVHHAQPLQMNHALWKYGGDTEYMIFADLDEYMLPKEGWEGRLIDGSDGHDVIQFASHWARTINGKIPKTIPKNILIDAEGDIKRSKCIYRTKDLKRVTIHGAGTEETYRMMMHFYNWSKPDREIEIKGSCGENDLSIK